MTVDEHLRIFFAVVPRYVTSVMIVVIPKRIYMDVTVIMTWVNEDVVI